MMRVTYTGPLAYVVTTAGNAYGRKATGSVLCIKTEDLSETYFQS